MQKFKFVLLLFIIPILNCKAQNNIEGFYSGKSYDPECDYDILVKFKNKTCIFSNNLSDTLTYQIKGNKLHFSDFLFSDDIEVSFQRSGDSLLIYRPKVDTLLYSFCKIKEENYIDKLVNKTGLHISMPIQCGRKKRIEEILYPKDLFFFLGKKNDSIILSYKNSNYKLDSLLYLQLRNKFKYYDYHYELYDSKPRLAFIDGDIKYSNILLFLWNLRMADHTKIWYVLDSTSPDSLNYIIKYNSFHSEIEYQQFLKFINPNNKLPPPPPYDYMVSEGIKNNFPLIEVFNNSILVDKQKFDSNLVYNLKNKLKTLKRLGLILTIDNNATYRDYIKIRSIIHKVSDELRNEGSQELFGKDYRELDHEKRIINKKYSFQTIEISKTEYEKIRNSQ